jgi:hypothetical protein
LKIVSCELFLLHTKLTPEQFRIAMSRPLGAIRSARATQTAGATQHETPAAAPSPVQELTKLAARLEEGLDPARRPAVLPKSSKALVWASGGLPYAH